MPRRTPRRAVRGRRRASGRGPDSSTRHARCSNATASSPRASPTSPRTAGLSQGSFYHYFESKEQIFREVAAAQEQRLTAPDADARARRHRDAARGHRRGQPPVLRALPRRRRPDGRHRAGVAVRRAGQRGSLRDDAALRRTGGALHPATPARRARRHRASIRRSPPTRSARWWPASPRSGWCRATASTTSTRPSSSSPGSGRTHSGCPTSRAEPRAMMDAGRARPARRRRSGTRSPATTDADAVLAGLGWTDMLAAEPDDAIAIVFDALGRTNATAVRASTTSSCTRSRGHRPRRSRGAAPAVRSSDPTAPHGPGHGARPDRRPSCSSSGTRASRSVPIAEPTSTRSRGIDPDAGMYRVAHRRR